MSVSCQSSGETTLYTHVKGYTFKNGTLDRFEAIAFSRGRIIDVGTNNRLISKYKQARIIDGKGRVMLPGLIDAHGHIMGLGFQQLNADISGITSLSETLDSLRKYAKSNPQLAWIKGRGWNQTQWKENRFPTKHDLDRVIADKPVWLERVDGHAGWANSRALEIAGITAKTKAPDDGSIIRDETGEPVGIFIDAAMPLIEKHIPEPAAEERKLALESALQRARRVGLTGVHDAGIEPKTWDLYKQTADRGELTLRIYAMIGGTGEAFDELAEDGPVTSYADNMLSLRSVKIYADGALGSRGAALLKAYSDDPDNRGLLFYEESELVPKIKKAASQGFQVNIHAIGDRANRVVLNAFEKVQKSLGKENLRNRIEHAQIVSISDIPRFKKLGIIASMQPTHATSDMNMAGARVGSARLEGAYAWQTFLQQGTIVASGSDFPVESANPFWGLYAAVTRQNHQGEPRGGWLPDQKMSRSQALKSFTLDAAYAGFMEDVTGTLEPGKWADFIIIDKDYFNISEQEIYNIKVLETWVAGKKVYSSN